MSLRQSTYQPRGIPATVDGELRTFLTQELRNISQAIGPNVIRSIAANEAQRQTDSIVLATGGAGGITYTLMAASAFPRFPVMVKKVDAAAGVITLGGTIDGVVNPTIVVQYATYTIVSDGTALYFV